VTKIKRKRTIVERKNMRLVRTPVLGFYIPCACVHLRVFIRVRFDAKHIFNLFENTKFSFRVNIYEYVLTIDIYLLTISFNVEIIWAFQNFMELHFGRSLSC